MNSSDRTRATGFSGLGRVALLLALPTIAAGQDDSTLMEWPVYGGNLASQFYSPLDQIGAPQRSARPRRGSSSGGRRAPRRSPGRRA
jgi:hypothetical protein